MKIGVDASRLTNKNRTGTENYLYYLLQALSKKDTKHEFVLYFKEEPSREFIREITNGKKNFSYKVLPSLGSWTQVGLALEIFKEVKGKQFDENKFELIYIENKDIKLNKIEGKKLKDFI